MKLVSLAEFKQVSSAGEYGQLEACAVYDKTNVVVAQGIYTNWAALVGALLGGPVYAVIGSSTFAGLVSQDYGSGPAVLGSGQGLVGPHAPSTAALCAAAGYGWVQTKGKNVVALTTDNSVDAGSLLIGTSTDGTWGGVVATGQALTATSGTVYSAGSHLVAGHSFIADATSYLIAAYGAWIDSVYAHAAMI